MDSLNEAVLLGLVLLYLNTLVLRWRLAAAQVERSQMKTIKEALL